MANVSMDADRFAQTLEQILSNVSGRVTDEFPKVVQRGVRKGASEWRKRARSLFDGHTYKRHGKKYTSGAYSESIRSRMLQKDGPRPSGVIGSAKLPGLAHLLEKGHVRASGGKVPGREHIAPSADVAFDFTIRLAEEMIDGVIRDA